MEEPRNPQEMDPNWAADPRSDAEDAEEPDVLLHAEEFAEPADSGNKRGKRKANASGDSRSLDEVDRLTEAVAALRAELDAMQTLRADVEEIKATLASMLGEFEPLEAGIKDMSAPKPTTGAGLPEAAAEAGAPEHVSPEANTPNEEEGWKSTWYRLAPTGEPESPAGPSAGEQDARTRFNLRDNEGLRLNLEGRASGGDDHAPGSGNGHAEGWEGDAPASEVGQPREQPEGYEETAEYVEEAEDMPRRPMMDAPPPPETSLVLVPLSEEGRHLRYRVLSRLSYPGMLALSRAVSRLTSVAHVDVSPESSGIIVLAVEVSSVESFLTDLAVIPGFTVRLEASWPN